MNTSSPALSKHFDALFAQDADPWGYRTRWYEQRKRAIVLASLPSPRYRRAYEPGCATGELTFELAQRCDAVLATDASEPAIRQARARSTGMRNVAVEQADTPTNWPAGEFDLIVFSELGYYLQDSALATFVERCAASLASDGVLLACHWRHPEGDFLRSGDEVHDIVRRRCGMAHLLHHLEDDFVLDVWTREASSVARREGLA